MDPGPLPLKQSSNYGFLLNPKCFDYIISNSRRYPYALQIIPDITATFFDFVIIPSYYRIC